MNSKRIIIMLIIWVILIAPILIYTIYTNFFVMEADIFFNNAYYVSNVPSDMVNVLDEYGVMSVNIEYFLKDSSGNTIIINGMDDSIDYSILKTLAYDNTIFFINVESTKKIANEILGVESYEKFVPPDNNTHQIVEICVDRSGKLMLSSTLYKSTEETNYEDLFKKISDASICRSN